MEEDRLTMSSFSGLMSKQEAGYTSNEVEVYSVADPSIQEILSAFEEAGKNILEELHILKDTDLIEKHAIEDIDDLIKKKEIEVNEKDKSVYVETQMDYYNKRALVLSKEVTFEWVGSVVHYLKKICESDFTHSPKASSNTLLRKFNRVFHWDDYIEDMERALKFIAQLKEMNLVYISSIDWKPGTRHRRVVKGKLSQKGSGVEGKQGEKRDDLSQDE